MRYLPTNLSQEVETALKETCKLMLAEIPDGVEGILMPITFVCSVTPNGRGMLSTYFTRIEMPMDPSRLVVHQECVIPKQEVEAFIKLGQEALWAWIRNLSYDFIGSALIMGADMPDYVTCNINSASRGIDISGQPEIGTYIRDCANNVAMKLFGSRAAVISE
jgi:hypothetical protein